MGEEEDRCERNKNRVKMKVVNLKDKYFTQKSPKPFGLNETWCQYWMNFYL